MAGSVINKAKKSEKARLWEGAKLKEEEEARKKLHSLRSAEASEISKAGLSIDVIVPLPTDSVNIEKLVCQVEEDQDESAKKPITRVESISSISTRDPPAAANTPSSTSAPPESLSISSNTAPLSVAVPSEVTDKRNKETISHLEGEVRSLTERLETVTVVKALVERNYVDTRKAADLLSRENEALKVREESERKRRLEAVQTNESLQKQIETLRAQLTASSVTSSSAQPPGNVSSRQATETNRSTISSTSAPVSTSSSSTATTAPSPSLPLSGTSSAPARASSFVSVVTDDDRSESDGGSEVSGRSWKNSHAAKRSSSLGACADSKIGFEDGKVTKSEERKIPPVIEKHLMALVTAPCRPSCRIYLILCNDLHLWLRCCELRLERGSWRVFSPGEMREGHGSYVFSNQNSYQGEWEQNRRHGWGVSKMSNARVYCGEWHHDKRTGHGIFTWPNGDVYAGHWRDSMRSGHGRYRWHDGREYEGDWVNDKRHGWGISTYPDGRSFVGNYSEGKRSGVGRARYPDGSFYEGQFQINKRDGFGRFTWPNGDCYTGMWLRGRRAGQGELYLVQSGQRLAQEWREQKWDEKLRGGAGLNPVLADGTVPPPLKPKRTKH